MCWRLSGLCSNSVTRPRSECFPRRTHLSCCVVVDVLSSSLFSLPQIMLQYNVSDFRNSLEFLTLFAKKRGFLQKGGVPNTEQAATAFLGDWTG